LCIKIKEIGMALKIDNDPLGDPTRNGCAPNDVYQIIARATPSSPMVFQGLLEWARLSAQVPSKPDNKTATRQLVSALSS
jgi:hypothetical protein